jgi:hypothetical protein
MEHLRVNTPKVALNPLNKKSHPEGGAYSTTRFLVEFKPHTDDRGKLDLGGMDFDLVEAERLRDFLNQWLGD